MNRHQRMVEEFTDAFEQPRAKEVASLGDGFPTELRVHLIREEAAELCEALERGDLVEAIDGMCDLLYVVYGTATSARIDLEPFFAEVHRSNMSKLDPETGKPRYRPGMPGRVEKPPGWTPPDIRGVLRATHRRRVRDDLHVGGRCRCYGEGTCEWCMRFCQECGGEGCDACGRSGLAPHR